MMALFRKRNPVQPAPQSLTRDKEEEHSWLQEIFGLVLMLMAVIGFHSLVAKPFYIPSISMMPTLLVGDRLIVSKYPYGWSWVSASFHVLPRSTWRIMPATPEYGDIVIVVPPYATDDWIKRVVALPGDRIAVEDGRIVLNGVVVPQEVEPPLDLAVDPNAPCDDYTFPYLRKRLGSGREVCELPLRRETLPNGASYTIIDHMENQPLDNMAEIAVPEGHVFLMGDNRDHSADSRELTPGSGLNGPVPLTNIGGRAEFITFSLDGSEGWNPLSWWEALREGRAWRSLRPEIRERAPTVASQSQGRSRTGEHKQI